MINDVASLLEEKGLRKTSIRVDILKLFRKYRHAISYREIESEIGLIYDSATIHRNLSRYEKVGLIHQVPNGSKLTYFALTKKRIENVEKTAEHIHFYCKSCEHIYCIQVEKDPNIKVPEGFRLDSKKISIQGLCRDCNN